MIADFDLYAAQCAPSVAATTLRAIATVESTGNRYAIGVVNGRLSRQPLSLPEAMSTVHALQKNGIRFSAGLIQINAENWPAYNLDSESVFDPCANMRAAAGILSSCYRRAHFKTSNDQHALRLALSCYYSNNFITGYQHGYVQKVVAVALSFDNPARKSVR